MSSKNFSNFWLAITSQKEAKARALNVLRPLNKYNKKAKKVLELGVGIGTVLQYFPKKYEISGLDILPENIKICKKKLSRGNFYVSSMHNFRIPEKFDVIFCVFDSINFLKDFRQWQSTFKSVLNHLNPKGLFIFDMYTKKALKDFKKSTPNITEFSMGYTYDKPIILGNKLTWDYGVFERLPSGLYKFHKYKWTEAIYTIPKVKIEISKHFRIFETHFMDKNRRILFVCKKKE